MKNCRTTYMRGAAARPLASGPLWHLGVSVTDLHRATDNAPEKIYLDPQPCAALRHHPVQGRTQEAHKHSAGHEPRNLKGDNTR